MFRKKTGETVKIWLFGKGVLCAAMAALCAFSVWGGNMESVRAEEGDITFRSAYATEKVLQDAEYTGGGAARVSVNACRGEYESAQIIMTANKDIQSYNAEVSDLVLNGSDARFPAENIAVYAEKYIEVKRNYCNNGAPAGMYPDCLLPIENAVASGENAIESGENQGLYITFNVPIDQSAGVYTGSMTVTYDGAETELPVTLTVYDLAVSETTHSRTKFNVTFSHYLGELDSTQAMFRAYVDKMVEYRISPSTVMSQNNLDRTDESIARYVQEASDLCENPRMSNFNIPAFTSSREGVQTIDRSMLTRYIVAFAEESLETGTDLLGRAIFSTGLIDEPDLNGVMSQVPVVTEDFNEGVNGALQAFPALFAKYPGVSQEFKNQLEISLQNIPLVVTSPYYESLADYVDTFCPYFSEYDSEERREYYKDQAEKWWYGCINPRPPYPSYQIEDNLVAARSISWMMSEYDVKGNLYWAVDVYAKYNGTVYENIEDFYAEAERYPQANGDGFLFYPGAKYGVYGPLPSIRIEAIRDGIEEYELWYELKNIYEAKGYTADEIQRTLSSLIYTGTQVASSDELFYRAREALIQLCLLAKSEAGVCIIGAEDDTYGNMRYEVFVNDGYELKSDGTAVTGGEQVQGGTLYEVRVALDQDVNTLNLSVDAGGTTYTFDYVLGGKATVYGAQTIERGFESLNATVAAETVTAPDGQSGEFVRLSVGATQGKWQSVRYDNAVLQNLGQNTSKMILHIYNAGESDIPFKILTKYSGYNLNVEYITTVLQPGMNTVTVSGISGFNWSRYGSIEYMDWYFSETSEGGNAVSVYLQDITVYTV